jgi:hypothetical protein
MFKTHAGSAELILVNSSAIRAVGYDGHTFTVEFHTGRTYDHPGVPAAATVEKS